MKVFDIEFSDFIGSKTRTVLAKDMKEAAEIADKMLAVALKNLWEDIEIEDIRYVSDITDFKEYVSEVEEKGKEIKENSEAIEKELKEE